MEVEVVFIVTHEYPAYLEPMITLCQTFRGQTCEIRSQWGIGLPQMCFGAGFILYMDIVVFIFGKLHENKGMKGSPAMFLLIAPPSVGVVSLDLLNDGASNFSQFGEMLLGWVFVLLLLLIRLGPILARNPSVFGEYWVSYQRAGTFNEPLSATWYVTLT